VASRLPPAVAAKRCRRGRSDAAAAAAATAAEDALPTRNRRCGSRSVFRRRRRRSVFVRSVPANVRGPVAHRAKSTTATTTTTATFGGVPSRPAAAFARPKRLRRLPVPLLLRGRSTAKDVVQSAGDAAAITAATARRPPPTDRTAAAAAVRLRQAPAVQIAGKPSQGGRAGRSDRVPPRRVREELSLRQSQTKAEGRRQGERKAARVEAPVHGESAVGPGRRRRGRQKL